MTLTFSIGGKIPAGTHQMKKATVINGKPRFYEPASLKAAREYYMTMLKPYAPEEPFEGAVSLFTTWYYKISKCSKFHPGFKTTAPDTDNLVKLLKDCMTACGYWKDDAQVAQEMIFKKWSLEHEGVQIDVRTIPE